MVTLFYINDNISSSGFKRLDYELFDELGYDVIEIKITPTPMGFVRDIWRVYSLVKKHKKHKKIFFSWFAYNCQGPVLGKILKIPSIIIAGGNDVSNDFYAKLGPNYMTFFSKTLVWFGLKYSTKIIAASNFVKGQVLRLCTQWNIAAVKSKTEVLYNAVDEKWMQNISRKKDTLVNYDYFITVGYLTKNNLIQKGYLTILEAVESNRIWMKKNKIKILFFGAEKDPTLRKQIKKRNIEEYALIIPYKKDSLPIYLANAVAYLQVSTHETFGVSMVEAMAVGCPVIASNVTALPEIAGNAALYVEPNNPKQLAERMITFYENKKMRRMLGERGKKRVDKYFSKEMRKKQLKALIEEII